MKQSANIFRVLIKTLLNAGIITDRTRAFYAMYVDMDGLKSEGERMIGDDIAEQGIQYTSRASISPARAASFWRRNKAESDLLAGRAKLAPMRGSFDLSRAVL